MDTDLDAQIREREKRSNDRVRKLRKERMAGDGQYAEGAQRYCGEQQGPGW